MPSQEHEALVNAMISNAQSGSSAPQSVEESRAGYEAMLAVNPVPGDAKIEPVTLGSVAALRVERPGARSDAALLYLHGGGYMIGSAQGYREFAARVAGATGVPAFVLDYRLAPEHPHPAAVEDAVAAVRALREQGFEASRIAIAGDSAGGGLALATLCAMRDAGDPLPACAVCLSPFADLSETGQPEANGDPLLGSEAIAGFRAAYLQGADAKQATASPVYADFSGFPPLLVQVGTRECLLSDALEVVAKAEAAGVSVQLEKGEGLIHVWPVFGPAFPESISALESIGAFVRKELS